MLRFAANLGFLFPELAFAERFAAARAAGFRGVEFALPYGHAAREIRARLDDHGLECVLFNLPYGAGARGPADSIAGRPGREAEFREGVDRALEHAALLGSRRVNCIAGAVPAGAQAARCEETLIGNLRHAAGRLEGAGVALVLEAINSRDVPGFLVDTCDRAAGVIARAGVANLGLQCDLYHAAMMGEDPAETLRRHRGIVRHVQFADVPGRGEPGSGRLDFGRLFAALEEIGYAGWTSAEYRPTRATPETLQWLAADS